MSRKVRRNEIGVTNSGGKFLVFFDPVVEHAKRTDDQERTKVFLLPKICIKCNRLQSLSKYVIKKQRPLSVRPLTFPKPISSAGHSFSVRLDQDFPLGRLTKDARNAVLV
jgi:hypothetical protein